MVKRKDLIMGTIYKRQLTYGIVYQAKVRVLGITACKNFSKKIDDLLLFYSFGII
jgi:hypothetical protein